MAHYNELPVYPVKQLRLVIDIFNGENKETYDLLLAIFQFTKEFGKENQKHFRRELEEEKLNGRIKPTKRQHHIKPMSGQCKFNVFQPA